MSPVASIAGGTDVCTAFVGPASLVPVRAGEISARLLGCAVEAYDPDGAAVPPGSHGGAGDDRTDAVDARRVLG